MGSLPFTLENNYIRAWWEMKKAGYPEELECRADMESPGGIMATLRGQNPLQVSRRLCHNSLWAHPCACLKEGLRDRAEYHLLSEVLSTVLFTLPPASKHVLKWHVQANYQQTHNFPLCSNALPTFISCSVSRLSMTPCCYLGELEL